MARAPSTAEACGLGDWRRLYSEQGGEVFCGRFRIRGAEARTFQVLGGGYSRDLHHVFYFSEKVPGADSGSFEVVDRGHRLAMDRNTLYRHGQAVERLSREPGVWPDETLRGLGRD